MRSLLAWSVARDGLPRGRVDRDYVEGIAPVPFRVRLAPRRPGKIIAAPFSLTTYTWVTGFPW